MRNMTNIAALLCTWSILSVSVWGGDYCTCIINYTVKHVYLTIEKYSIFLSYFGYSYKRLFIVSQVLCLLYLSHILHLDSNWNHYTKIFCLINLLKHLVSYMYNFSCDFIDHHLTFWQVEFHSHIPPWYPGHSFYIHVHLSKNLSLLPNVVS